MNDDELTTDDDSEASDYNPDDEDHGGDESGETANDNDATKAALLPLRRGAASTSRLLEHATLKDFCTFVKFFRLDVDGLIPHSWTQFDFSCLPGRHTHGNSYGYQ